MAFASWDILYPLEVSASVALCLPENDGISRTLSEFPRSARSGDAVALGLLFTPGGVGVLSWRLDAANPHVPQPARVSPFEHHN
jgi:hypothetical protein